MIAKIKKIGKHIDELKAHTTKYAIKSLHDSDIHSDINVTFGVYIWFAPLW